MTPVKSLGAGSEGRLRVQRMGFRVGFGFSLQVVKNPCCTSHALTNFWLEGKEPEYVHSTRCNKRSELQLLDGTDTKLQDVGGTSPVNDTCRTTLV